MMAGGVHIWRRNFVAAVYSAAAMSASRAKNKTRFVLNAACCLVALLAAVWILVGRHGDDSLAFAAGGGKTSAKAALSAAPAADAGPLASAERAVEKAPEKAEKADKDKEDGKGKKDGPPEPIDLAVAPDGGVPHHPGATHFKSPFAKPGDAHPEKVKVALLLNTIDGYDIKTGTFTADFFLSLTSTEPMPAMNLVFPNGSLDKKEDIADKPTFKLFRLSGSFKSPADLRKYPFDSQELKIVIEDDANGIDQLDFVVDKERTQLARGFRSVGWQVAYVDARVQSQSYPERFQNDDLFYSRYTFTLGVDRFATSAAFTVFVPAFVIVLISLLGMWVPADEMEVRSNSGAPMLAGAVLFHFALMQELPATSYLTRADKLMLGVYVSLALGMISTWWMFLVKEENVPVVFRVARVAVPILSAITMALACFA
jgi:hypothetical protein